MVPKSSQPDFKLSPGQELLRFIWLYIHPSPCLPTRSLCVCIAPSPRPQPDTGSGSSCRFELALFHMTFGKEGNFASPYVVLVSVLISEIKSPG